MRHLRRIFDWWESTHGEAAAFGCASLAILALPVVLLLAYRRPVHAAIYAVVTAATVYAALAAREET